MPSHSVWKKKKRKYIDRIIKFLLAKHHHIFRYIEKLYSALTYCILLFFLPFFSVGCSQLTYWGVTDKNTYNRGLDSIFSFLSDHWYCRKKKFFFFGIMQQANFFRFLVQRSVCVCVCLRVGVMFIKCDDDFWWTLFFDQLR